MKKTNWTLFLFIILGLLAGTIVGELLNQVNGLGFLTKSAQISWEPKANLQVISYDLHLLIKLNLISLLGVIAAIWLYRRM